MLENDRITETLQFLVEFGVPTSAIKKIERFVPTDVTSDEAVISFIRNNKDEIKKSLIKYEWNLIDTAVN